MIELLQKFSLQNAKFNAATYSIILIVWLLVLACAATSILSHPFTARQRIFWLGVIIAAPVIGILAYLPFSLNKEDLPQIFRIKRPKKPARISELTETGTGGRGAED